MAYGDGVSDYVVISNVGTWSKYKFGVVDVVHTPRQFIRRVIDNEALNGIEVELPVSVINLDTEEAYDNLHKQYNIKIPIMNCLATQAIVIETNDGDHVYIAALMKPFVGPKNDPLQ